MAARTSVAISVAKGGSAPYTGEDPNNQQRGTGMESTYQARFGELPPGPNMGPRRLAEKGLEAATQLVQNPGKWALIRTAEEGGSAGVVSSIRYGQIKYFAQFGKFEAESRNPQRVDGVERCDVWARFVGAH